MLKITSTLFLFLFTNLSLWSQDIQFIQHSLVSSTSLKRDVKAVDMDIDGDMDVLVTSGGNVEWFRNVDGNGTFYSLAVVVAANVFNLHVGNAADVDGDGDMDVVVGLGTTASNSEVAWFKNMDGLGTTFSTKITLTTVGDEFREVVAADFDGDMDMDIAFGSYQTNEVKWMRNTDGAGAFSAPTTLFSSASGIRFMAFADTDGDDDQDFFTSSFYPVAEGQFTQYRNSDGLGTFVRQKVNNLDGQNAAGIAAGDLDGDGDVDLVGCIYNSDVVYWYKNDGLGNYGGKINITNALDGPYSVCIDDLEGDGDNDLVVAAENGNTISYLLNNGLGVFAAPVLVSTALSFSNASFNASRLIATADFDSDGDMDIAAISTGVDLAWFEQEIPLVIESQTQNPSCNGASDGSIFIQVSGGTAPYNFLWNNVAIQGDSIYGLPAGTYNLTITDNNFNQLEQSFTLTAPPEIVLTMNVSPAVTGQNNGTASVLASGGVGNYNYFWSNGATTADLTDLAPGAYSVTVTDANGCTQTNSVVVDEVVAAIDPGLLTGISVWPNPANGWLQLDLSKVIYELKQLDLLNADGRLLRRLEAGDLRSMTTMQWEKNQPGGFVMLVFYGKNGGMYSRKVIIE